MDKTECLKLEVPTYNGKWIESHGLPDFDEPRKPVFVCPSDGVRIALGANDFRDNTSPDIQIERRHNGWMIFLHPQGAGDASGYVIFLDDGRSFLVKEHPRCSAGTIEVVDYKEALAELDENSPV